MNAFHNWYCRSKLWRRMASDRLVPWALKGVPLGDSILELGPGPGATTEALLQRGYRVAAAEVDAPAAYRLRHQLGRRAQIVNADATNLPWPDGTFDSVVCFTMLHHIPSAELQDCLLREAHRLIRPGGYLAGSDSRTSPLFRLAHLGDTHVPVDPTTFADRIQAAGFHDVRIRSAPKAFRFQGRTQV